MAVVIEDMAHHSAKERQRAFSVDVAVNVAFAIVSTLGVLWLTRLSTATLSAIGLALFLGVRRYSSSISALANLGGPLFQIRYMGMHANDERLADLIALFVTAVFAFVSVALCIGLFFGKELLSRYFPIEEGYPPWFLWMVLVFSVEQLLHFSVQNYLLVKRQIVSYNIYKFLAATGLFLPFFLLEKDIGPERVLASYLTAGAALIAIGHGFTSVRPLLQKRRLPWERMRWIVSEATVYGPPRAVVNFLDSLMFVLPAWLLRGEMAEAGYLLTIFIFVQATAVVILPINELAMVVSANHLGSGDAAPMNAVASTLFELLLVVSGALVAVIYPFRDTFFRLVIGSSSVRAGVGGYGALLTCIVPVTVFSGLKGMIEVRWRQPRNLVNLILSQAALIACYYALRRSGSTAQAAILFATLISLWSVGVLTVVIGRALLTSVNWMRLARGVAVVVAACVANTFAAALLAHAPTSSKLVAACLAGIVTFSLALRIAAPNVWFKVRGVIRRRPASIQIGSKIECEHDRS